MPRWKRGIFEWNGPDLSVPGVRRLLEKALDAALLAHRRVFLPRHFEAAAIARYPAEYAAACPRRDTQAAAFRKMDRETLSRRLKSMTPDQRRRYFSEWRDRQRQGLAQRVYAERGRVSMGTRLRSIDRRNEIPLVDTGRMRASVTAGAATIAGPVHRRHMDLQNLPAYAPLKHVNDKGVFDKVLAVQAVRSDETDEFARVMDQTIQQALNATA